MITLITQSAKLISGIEQGIIDFEQWQQGECAILNISIGDHNKLLKIINEIQCTGVPIDYDDFIAITRQPMELFRTKLEV